MADDISMSLDDGSGSAPQPEQLSGPTDASDPINTYVPQVQQIFQQAASTDSTAFTYGGPNSPELDPSLASASPSDNAKQAAGDSWIKSMRTFFGFPDTDQGKSDFGKAAVPIVGTIGAGLVAGAGAGYAAAQKRKIEEEQVQNQKDLNASLIALNKSKTGQNLSGLKYTAGLIGTPAFRTAPLTPVTSRTA